MRITSERTTKWLLIAVAGVLACLPARAELITNGGFESGFAGWSRLDQLGSEGTFFIQTGTLSPVNGFAVPAPPEGTSAAMTDAEGPGTHVLYQDFIVPAISTGYQLSFSLFLNNANGAPQYYTPDTLDFSTPALNQQARVDIMRSTADPFSVDPADILATLYRTNSGDPLLTPYLGLAFDVTPLLQAETGQTLRLRFAAVDNVAPFNVGIDNVSIEVVPEPSTWAMMIGAVAGLAVMRRRRLR
jgi:hypothetical protein